MGVKRLGDRFIAINLVLEKNIIQIIGVDALKIGSDESITWQFWPEMDGLKR